MKRLIKLPFAIAVVMLAVSCSATQENVCHSNEKSSLVVDLGNSRVTLGEKQSDGRIPLRWSEGDCIAANGKSSSAAQIDLERTDVATFNFSEVLTYPCNLLYPASFYKNATTITLPLVQMYSSKGLAANTLPMASCITSEGEAPILKHLVGIVHLQIKAAEDAATDDLYPIRKIVFEGGEKEQLCGDFEIDYESNTLIPISSQDGKKITVDMMSTSLSTAEITDVYIVVPAREYSSGYKITIVNTHGGAMSKTKSSSQTLHRGEVVTMPVFEFKHTHYTLDVGI